MAAKYYSWSTFPRTGVHYSEQIKQGDEVTASDFDSEDEFNELVSIGAIRTTPYPIPRDEDTGELMFQGSPREYALHQVAQMSDEAVADNFWRTPPLQEKAVEAMDAADYHPEMQSDEQAAETERAEKAQPTRKSLEGTAGKGLGAAKAGHPK